MANRHNDDPITTSLKGVDTVNADRASEGPESGPTPDVGWSVDKGTERENNEDSLAAITVNQAGAADSESLGVYAVADGMGGQASGEIASQLAIHTAVTELLGSVTETDAPMPDSYRRWLEAAVSMANGLVYQKAREEKKEMGTTLVIAVVVGNDVHIANVGDSRAYLIRSNGMHQITHDQSLVQALIDTGVITPDQASEHPYRNVLTQAIGSRDQVKIDLFNETLLDGESLLLCSDGLWGTLSDTEILDIVQKADSPSAACQALVDACNARGASDNIAVVLVRPRTEPPPG